MSTTRTTEQTSRQTRQSRPMRRLVVVGADGPLGEAVTRDALLRTVEVVSAAADPSRVARISPSQRILGIDAGDPVGLDDALVGASAVIFAFEDDAPGADDREGRAELLTAVARRMRRGRIDRAVAASSLALSGEASDPQIDRGLRRAAISVLGAVRGAPDPLDALADLRHCEMLLDGSGLDWTVLRAGRLNDLLGTRSPQLRDPVDVVADRSLRRGSLPREDLARALVDTALAAGDPASRVQAVLPGA